VSKTRVDRVRRVKLVDSCRTQSKRVRLTRVRVRHVSDTNTPLIWACPCFRGSNLYRQDKNCLLLRGNTWL